MGPRQRGVKPSPLCQPFDKLYHTAHCDQMAPVIPFDSRRLCHQARATQGFSFAISSEFTPQGVLAPVLPKPTSLLFLSSIISATKPWPMIPINFPFLLGWCNEVNLDASSHAGLGRPDDKSSARPQDHLSPSPPLDPLKESIHCTKARLVHPHSGHR